MDKNYDFSGWATKALLRCSDGRTIMRDAFKDQDGETVPLVWNHQHNGPDNVLGHALLENREDGVYSYCSFNETPNGKKAKTLVEHGDVVALSIFANQLKQQGANVIHGMIREVSLVLAGANPGAFIDNVISHGDKAEENEESAIIFTGEEIELSPEVSHSDDSAKEINKESNRMDNENKADNKAENKEKTIKDVFDGMTEEQQTVVYALVGQALEQGANENDNDNDSDEDENNKGDNETMKHNVFDTDEKNKENVLSHSEMTAIIADAKRYGSLKESTLEHGITNIEYLFPDSQNVTSTPKFIDRDTRWVAKVMAAVHHTPFSRVKSTFANITADEARAKGYVKGKKKTDEVFTLLKRTTDPTTVYKHQTLDRDDIVDITDLDVVAWVKTEMRGKLDEELARAFLVGDGRVSSSNDKIDPLKIRPIWGDDELYAVNAVLEAGEDKAREFIKSCIKARKNYKGSGSPTLYTTEDMLTDCLLLEDTTGRPLYDSEEKLATKLRVKEIVTVPVMEGLTREVSGENRNLLGIIVNLNDYNVGADKGGAVNMFDDFDIDYNQQKYLIETRCSGALVVPYSAIVVEEKAE